MAEEDRIARQIEISADYYPPGTYSGTTDSFGSTAASYLTYYNNIVLNSDSLASQYIPISGASRNPMLFAIGIIPPSANVTGRILDRSASAVGLVVDDSRAVETISSDNSKGLSGSALPHEFWVEYVSMCQRLGVSPVELAAVLQAESGFDAASVAIRDGRPVAKGLNQIIKKNSDIVGLAPGEWDTFEEKSAREQLPYVEAYFRACGGIRGADRTRIYGKNFGGFSNPNGSRYASLAFINNYQPEEDRVRFRNPTEQQRCYEQNIGLDKERKGFITTEDLRVNVGNGPSTAIRQRIADAEAFLKSGGTLNPTPVQRDANPDTFKRNGSESAGDYRRIQEKTANTPLTAEDIAQKFTAAQHAQIKEVQRALEAMQNVPPLRMRVNPSSFAVRGEKITADSAWTRNGRMIVEHWGDGQEKISASGKVAGFYAIDASNAVGPGITRMARNYSQAWQNFQSLSLFYANNGGLHTADATTGKSDRNLTMLGSVYIYYDSILYIGSFDSLSVSETDTSPFTVDYSFEFSVRAAFLLDNPNPNDLGTYGVTIR